MNLLPVVLDTNWTLDLLLFKDPRTQAFATDLAHQHVQWWATPAMRAELERVLGYTHLLQYMARFPQPAAQTTTRVLQEFDAFVLAAPEAPKCNARCRDPDDQIFIDLAVAHQASLLSKDRAVLAMRRSVAGMKACISDTWPRKKSP
ncbi:MAG: hypothetical protein RI959_869 [Pseudomonadota bacterium]|jgi:putative PIN family toxin of toxin-antitoxin system